MLWEKPEKPESGAFDGAPFKQFQPIALLDEVRGYRDLGIFWKNAEFLGQFCLISGLVWVCVTRKRRSLIRSVAQRVNRGGDDVKPVGIWFCDQAGKGRAANRNPLP